MYVQAAIYVDECATRVCTAAVFSSGRGVFPRPAVVTGLGPRLASCFSGPQTALTLDGPSDVKPAVADGDLSAVYYNTARTPGRPTGAADGPNVADRAAPTAIRWHEHEPVVCAVCPVCRDIVQLLTFLYEYDWSRTALFGHHG